MSDYHIIENPLADFDTTLEEDSGIDSTNRSPQEIEGDKEKTSKVEETPSLKKLLDETPLTTNMTKTKSPKQLNQTKEEEKEEDKEKEEKSPSSSPVKIPDVSTPATIERKNTAAGLIALAHVMCSDSEDDDYMPGGGGEEEEKEEEEAMPLSRQYKLRDVTKGVNVEEETKAIDHTDDDKKKADDLWSAFKADVSKPLMRRPKLASSEQCKDVTYDFAGESVTVREVVKKEGTKNKRKSFMNTLGLSDMDRKRRRESAPTLPKILDTEETDSSAPGPAAKKPVSKLSSLVNRLAKKPKMSILNKTSLDWDKYKADKGIEDEVKNEAKGGYLEKQDFLSRTDERQYELEKEIRLQIQRRRQMMNSKQF